MARQYDIMMKKAKNILKWLPTKIEERYASGKDELFGHTFERHFECDSRYLKQRCLDKHEDATAFFVNGEKGRNVLRQMIVHTLLDEYNLEDIALWLSDPTDTSTMEIEVTAEKPVGHGYAYINKEAKHRVTCETLLILEKVPNCNDFRIKTVYLKL